MTDPIIVMTREQFEDLLADLINEAARCGLGGDEILDALALQRALLEDEMALEEADHG